MQRVADPDLAEALADADDAVDRMFAAGVTPAGVDDAYALVRALDRQGRRTRALQVLLLGEIDRLGLHKADGHGSAKVMVRCAANLCGPDAFRLDQAQSALAALPVVAAAFGRGLVGVGQVERVARTFANKRVRAKLIAVDEHVAVLAARLPYPEFDQRLTDWERLEDEDGAGDRAARAHRNRNARLDCGLDGVWDFLAKFGSIQGAEIAEIFSHFVEAERMADWAEARARIGDTATADDLVRTEPQRRADAFHAAMRAAASAWAAAPGGSIIVTNIVMDLTTFERQLRRVAGTDPGADPRPSTDLAQDAADLEPLDVGQDRDRDEDGGCADGGDPDRDGRNGGADGSDLDEDGGRADGGDPAHDSRGVEADGSDQGTAPDPARPTDRPGPSGCEPSEDLEPVAAAATEHAPHADDDTWDPWAPLPEPFPPERTRSARGEPPRASGAADPRNGTRFACRTLDGKPVDPAEATAHTLLGHVRRVVIGSDGVVLDMGRRTRLFTGLRQLAVRLPELTCTHPGCSTPVSQCQSDHLNAYNGPRQGRTDPGNGAPSCGKHNRIKETHRITPRRDEHGRWHHYRPDGTEIPRPGDP